MKKRLSNDETDRKGGDRGDGKEKGERNLVMGHIVGKKR